MRQDDDEPDLRGDAAFRTAQAAQAQADKNNARMDIANLLAPQGISRGRSAGPDRDARCAARYVLTSRRVVSLLI